MLWGICDNFFCSGFLFPNASRLLFIIFKSQSMVVSLPAFHLICFKIQDQVLQKYAKWRSIINCFKYFNAPSRYTNSKFTKFSLMSANGFKTLLSKRCQDGNVEHWYCAVLPIRRMSARFFRNIYILFSIESLQKLYITCIFVYFHFSVFSQWLLSFTWNWWHVALRFKEMYIHREERKWFH